MPKYILKRLLGMLPLLLGISLLSFAMIHLAPGHAGIPGQEFNPRISADDIERMRIYYGLDKPLHIQYWEWLQRLVQLDFGDSFAADHRSVLDKVLERLPITLWMNVLAMLFVLLLAIPIGVFSAVHQKRFFDRAMTVCVFVAFAMPSFWLGLLLMIWLGVEWQWLPISGLHAHNYETMGFWQAQWDLMQHLLLPVFVSAVGGLAGMSRFMRSGMLDVIHSDYITCARAMGVPERRVHYRYALKNALLPVITLLGLSIPGLIGGSVIIEQLFSIPGLGLLFYESVLMRDYPLVMGLTVIGAVLTLIGNLVADLSYAWVDPRIRMSSSS
ncbi:MAG: ABC transporter permease [Mariprofundaceae bacterium]|nr:ABC transporter permease [Mariprofundaceae bacterium]